MHNPQSMPAYVIVDMEPLINHYLTKYPSISKIYQYLPLTEMIRLLLVTGMDSLSSLDLLTTELSERLPPDMEIDTELINFFIEELATEVDQYINSKFPLYYQTGSYLYLKWVNNTSIMLYNIAHSP